MRAFRRICNEVDTASMPAKMRRIARARLDRVNSEYQRATRVVEKLLQAHGERHGERRPPAGGGYREEQKRRDDLCSGCTPDPRMECEDSIPMERRSTLPVNEILASERRERSWESAAVPGRGATPARLTEVEGLTTSTWRDRTSARPHASREGPERSRQPAPAHRWA